jgi:RNA polymerase sigma factor (sigma-70 family)
MTDAKVLIDKILAGNPNAFTQLVRQHERLVSQIVFRIVPSRHDREDICQDVFIKVYQNLDRFEYQSKLSTWIARIAYNTALNYVDKKRVPLFDDQCREGESLDSCESEQPSPAEWTASRQAAVRLCEEIDKLPTIYGTIVSLFHLHDMSYADIADILSLPDGTVKSYLFRARQMLKERMMARYSQEELCA